MSDDKLEGLEVDRLIKHLAKPAPKPSVTRPAAPPPVAEASSVQTPPPGPVPTAPPPPAPVKGTPDPMRAPLPSIAIPARKEVKEPSGPALSLPSLPALPKMPALPKLTMPKAPRLPRVTLPKPRMPRFPKLPRLPQLRMPGMPKMPGMPPLPQWRSSRRTRIAARMPGQSRWAHAIQTVLKFVSAQRPEIVVRSFVGLGVLLALAMPYWPYPKTCAWWLFFYLFAVAIVLLTGVWTARLTWITRQGIAHVLALGILIWGITLAAEETLPRVGYAKAEAVWFCQY